MCVIISFLNRVLLLPFNLNDFWFFSCLTVLDGTSNIMLKIDESGNPFIYSYLGGKAFSVSPLSIMLPVGFNVNVFSYFFLVKEENLLFVESFYHAWWLAFVKCFLYISHFFSRIIYFERNTSMAFREVCAEGRTGKPVRNLIENDFNNPHNRS